MPDTIANSIALITKYSTEGFDKVYKADALSSRIDAQPGMFQFTGTKTVKIAKMTEGGLSDYTRNNNGDERVNGDEPWGYQSSSMGLTWEERTISQDRAGKYAIEKFDNEESGDLVLGTATSRISKNVIAPEVDSYCFSTIAKNAGVVVSKALETATHDGVAVKLALKPFNAMFKYFDDEEIPNTNQIIFLSTNYFNALREDTTELTRFMQQPDYEKNINFKVTKYEDRELVLVPPRRFQTGFIGYKGGYRFGPHTNADGEIDNLPKGETVSKPIDFIGMAKDAAVHIVKYQKIKILTDEVALAATNLDGYAIYVRIYHDVFVMDNKRKAIYLHLDAFADSDYSATEKALDTLEVSIASGKISKVLYNPEDRHFTLLATTRATAPKVGENLTFASATDKVVNVGTAITATTTFVAVVGSITDGTGVVSAVYTYTKA